MPRYLQKEPSILSNWKLAFGGSRREYNSLQVDSKKTPHESRKTFNEHVLLVNWSKVRFSPLFLLLFFLTWAFLFRNSTPGWDNRAGVSKNAKSLVK